jgi:predicted ArsR family transcriptional regulator
MRDTLQVTPDQLRLMSYGPRSEIIAALANDSGLSARDLSARLRRPVTGLYRHLALLTEAGVLRHSGQRPGRKRPEVLYALAAKVFSSIKAAQTPDGRQAFAVAVSRHASAASRRIRRAVEAGNARIGVEADANTRMQVSDLQLDRAGLEELHRLIDTFVVRARKLRVRSDGAQETVKLTLFISPDAQD